MTDLTIPARFCGPPHSGNGGWTAGALADLVATRDGSPRPTIEVTLRRPPPLGRPLSARGDASGWVIVDGAELVAEAHILPTEAAELRPVAPVAAGEARAAEARYPGHAAHPFPTCFVCGPDRAPGDGLRIFPGPSSPGSVLRAAEPRLDLRLPQNRVAATWTPDPSLIGTLADRTSMAVAWAALDCAGGWTSPVHRRPMVLGQMRATIGSLPRIGMVHVIVGEPRGGEGRKVYTACSAYDDQGLLVATAEHVWFYVDPVTFGAASR